MLNPFADEYYMQIALQQAQIALEEGEIPVGAVVVCQDKIIAKAYNQTERLKDVTAHAEMLALTAAANALGGKYLRNCTLYVTLEPCVMCGGALFWSQIGRIVIGAMDDKRGCSKVSPKVYHPKTHIVTGILSEASQTMLRTFFQKLR